MGQLKTDRVGIFLNLLSYEIFQPNSRYTYWSIFKWLLASFNGSYTLTNNGYNPTQEQIKKVECSGE